MAVNRKDLTLANGERQPKSEATRKGADWYRGARGRIFKHQALAAAFARLLPRVAKP
jgi:hypothetical protein